MRAPPAKKPVACRHCGTLVERGPYCCAGCEGAALILEGAGLDAWYDRRTGPASRPQLLDSGWEEVPVAVANGRASARLAIDGLRCASCVWVCERLLQGEPGVVDAHVSYATGRATVGWDPDKTNLRRIAGRVAAVGYQPRPLHVAETPDRDLLMRLGVAVFCLLNLMTLTATLYVGWFQGMSTAWADLFRGATLLLATPVALWSAQPFYFGAVRSLSVGRLHMDLPISLAVGLLYGHGVWATLNHFDGYLDSVAMLVTLLLVGRLLEARGRRAVQDAVTSMASELPTRARRVVDRGVEDIPASQLVEGDLVEVASGGEIPADGVVVSGTSEVGMSLVTGESEPRDVTVGDPVVAGGSVEGPALRVRVTAVGARSLLGRMASALEVSLDRDERTDPLAPWFTGGTLLAAALTAFLWFPAGPAVALERVVAVLVVACPCALSLAHPLTGAAGLAVAARKGLLLRSVDALFRLAEIEAIALDKTGTLTSGTPRVITADDEALRLAAGLERSSDHPVARAIIAEAVRREIPLPSGEDVVEVSGVGIHGMVDGEYWSIRAGPAGTVLVESASVVHTIRLRDTPRDDVVDVVEELNALDLPITVLTGDRAPIAARVAGHLDLPFHAELDPLQKAAWLRSTDRRTLFVGDGLNDTPALAFAHVGLAMGMGASTSVLAADGVVARDGLMPVVAGLRVARAAQAAKRRSLGRSIAYNLVAVGAAMAGLVNPLVAAVLMPISSLLVVYEATRLRRTS